MIPLSRRARSRLGLLQASVCKLAGQRNEALRLFIASRHATTPAAQREFWLEFSWVDQEYRAAVHRLAEFCRQRLAVESGAAARKRE
ncbi:MAG TPA: hypothetical protein VGT07_16260 [Steroidobacteraceae bacterium]|nr:hypothetical protein [Steroidobacteraceae bacterium]